MARRDYFTQACPEPWQILGLRLLPFSLGHYIKLKRLECAFVADEARAASMYDLLIGVACCSMATEPDPSADPFWRWFYGESEARLRLRVRNAVMRCLRKPPLSPSEYDMLLWGRHCGVFELEEKVKLFQNYILQHSTVPGFWEDRKDGGGVTTGAHWSHSILAVLCARGNYDQRLALNVPLSKAIWDFYKIAENEGGGRMMSEEELAATGGLNGV